MKISGCYTTAWGIPILSFLVKILKVLNQNSHNLEITTNNFFYVL